MQQCRTQETRTRSQGGPQFKKRRKTSNKGLTTETKEEELLQEINTFFIGR